MTTVWVTKGSFEAYVESRKKQVRQQAGIERDSVVERLKRLEALQRAFIRSLEGISSAMSSLSSKNITPPSSMTTAYSELSSAERAASSYIVGAKRRLQELERVLKAGTWTP